MATAEQFISLVRSHTRQDDDRFLTVVNQVVRDAESRGQGKVAAELKALIADAAASSGVVRRSADPISMVRPRGDLSGVMSVAMPERRLSQMVLEDDLDRQLSRIVREQRERGRLLERSLKPRRKFLLTGPPGTGKTVATGAIAAELGLPLFTILLDGLITKYMGETAAKLRLVFDAMAERRGVYFFDEVDAIAGSRGADNEVGEARRILVSFLQFLDDENSTSLVFAATNHPEILDRAFARRFDATIGFHLPSEDLIRPLVEDCLAAFDLLGMDWAEVRQAARGLSQADVVRASDDAARVAVLEHEGVLTSRLLSRALREVASGAR